MADLVKPFSHNSITEINRLDAALEAAGIGSWELDLNNKYFRICRRFKSLFEYSGKDIIPYNELLALVYIADQQQVDEAIQKAIQIESGGSFEMEIRTANAGNAQPRWLRWKGQVYFNEQEQPYQFSGIIQDVTAQVESRQQLYESEVKLRTLVDNTPDVITRWNTELQLIFTNPAFENKTGTDNASLLGKTKMQMGQPESVALPYMKCLQAVIDSRMPKEHYYSFFTHKGESYFYSRLVPEFGPDGEVQSVLAIARDITELKASEARFQTIVEQAPMAIGLFNSREMIIEIGNDKIFEVWGKDRSILGMHLMEALPEIKGQGFLELLEGVFDTGVPFFGNEMQAKLLRKGQMQDVYFDLTYTPVRDTDNNDISGVMVLAVEVTEKVTAKRIIEKSEAKFRLLIEEAPAAICLLAGIDMKIELANETMLGYWGKTSSVIGKKAEDALPHLQGQGFFEILSSVYTTGITHTEKSAERILENNGVADTFYFDFTFKPLLDLSGQVYAILNMAVDVTQQVKALIALEESESRLRSVLAAAPAGIGLFTGRDFIIEMPNQAFIDILGKGPDITGKPLRQIMPELKDQAFLQVLEEVYTSGKMSRNFASQINIVQQGVMTNNFYNVSYTPLLNSVGKVYAILEIAIDVTEAVKTNQRLEESEQFSRSLFYNSPVANMVVTGEDMEIVTINKNMLNLLGRDLSVIGKKFAEALPELSETNLPGRLIHAFRTGQAFNQPEEMLMIVRNGEPYTGYYNYIHQPLRNMNGEIYGIVITASELTRQVLARQEIEEAENTLRSAVEMADLAMWSINPATGIITHSERMTQWLGMEQNETELKKGMSHIPQKDRARVEQAIQQAMLPHSDGNYNEEHLIENRRTGRRRIIQSHGKTFFDSQGKPYKLIGISRDITEQHQMRLALEQQVQQRTEELATMNEELAAINEEYSATNEELAGLNQLLLRSNESLQRFSYVASHDLQEPLRKIQSFSDLLIARYAAQLGDGAEYLKRMQSAATRMSVLIDDLLSFSRISTYQDATTPVNLNDAINHVLTDLELKIQETGAIITVGILPVIQGDQSQLNQLFQNLISNALKFVPNDTVPVITVSTEIRFAADLPSDVIPGNRVAAYHRVDVADNGIGFDQKHAQRIFQVFQRLHGKNEFPGTGIGLAICEKVVSNHGGAIAVKSQPGQGSVFSVYLPV